MAAEQETETPVLVVEPPAEDPKPRYDSKTYWVNGLAIVACLVATVYYTWKAGTFTPEAFTAMFGAIWSVVQLALRETTTAPLMPMMAGKKLPLVLAGLLLACAGIAAAASPAKVPDVRGMTFENARETIRAKKLVPKRNQPGSDADIVKSQSPLPGEPIETWKTVHLSDVVQVQAPLVPSQDPIPVPSVKSLVGDHEGKSLVLPNLPHGTYILRIPETGPATVELAEDVVPVGPGPGPTPIPPIPPAPLSDFGKAIKAAADKATGDTDRVNTAQGLAMLYRSISAEAHKAGSPATVETVSNTTLLVTDMALTKQGATAVAAWADMRATLRAGIVDAIQKGKSVGDVGDLLDQAAAGLEASAPKTAVQAPSPAFWDFLLKLIAMLLPLLIPK